MPTNPTEWRERLHAELVTYSACHVSTYLTALLREWDAHEPERDDDFLPIYRTCDACGVDLPDEGLCPARRRMMGGGDV